MGNELVPLTAFQDEFSARSRLFGDVLAPYRIPLASFRAGVVSLLEQQGWILKSCEPMSVVNAAMSIAVQGLTLDQATGQACVVPFKRRAQPITMVRGYTVLAGRAKFTLQGFLVRDGDKVKEVGGVDAKIEHEIAPGHKGRVVGAYAVAKSLHFPAMFSPLITIDELIAIRDRSKGYQGAPVYNGKKQHPWDTDFEAMCIKTPKRLLAKDIPNDLLQAASWLETQHDMGNVAYLREDGKGVIEGEGRIEHIGDPQPTPEQSPIGDLSGPRFIIKLNNREVPCDSVLQWRQRMLDSIGAASLESCDRLFDLNEAYLADYERADPEGVAIVREAFRGKIGRG